MRDAAAGAGAPWARPLGQGVSLRNDLHFSASGEFSESILALRFVTLRQGAVVTTSNDGRGWLYLTHDAGRTWGPVRF